MIKKLLGTRNLSNLIPFCFRSRFLKKLIFMMRMNKNSICGWASFCTFLIGATIILLGILKYNEYAIGFSTVGVGFFVLSWAFNALKGRV